jgi:hypothetical protein
VKLLRSFALLGLSLLGNHPCDAVTSDFAGRARQQVEAMVRLAPRPSGTLNERRAANYIAGQFKGMGLPARIEPFDFESFEVSRVELKVDKRSFRPAGLGIDPYGPGWESTPFVCAGEFVFVDSDSPSTWPDSLQDRVILTALSEDPSLHFRLAAREPRCIIYLSPGDFARTRGMGGRQLTLRIQGRLRTGHSQNVVAHLGALEPAPQIIMGAHLDAYRTAPGANDNATGIAALLELARQFKQVPLPEGIGISLVAFGGEELAVLGSRHYVARHADELRHCALAVVWDNLGGDGPVQIERNGGSATPPSSPGRSQLSEAYLGRTWEGIDYPWRLTPPPILYAVMGTAYHPAWLGECIDAATRELDFQTKFTAGVRGSDEMAFAQAGVATCCIGAVNDRAHTSEDLPATVNFERVAQCTDAAARIVQKVIDHLRTGGESK